MLHFTLDLRWTTRLIGAVMQCLAFVTHQRRAAFRALLDIDVRTGIRFPAVKLNTGDLWDDFATLLHVHIIALTDIQFRNLVGVMQRGTLDRSAGQQHGFEVGHRGDGSGSSDLVGNPEEFGAGGLGLEFIGYGPPWTLGGNSQCLLLRVAVDFDHHPVNIKGQRMPLLVPVIDKVNNAFKSSCLFNHPLSRMWHLKTPGRSLLEGRIMVIERNIIAKHTVEEAIQCPVGYQAAVLLL